MGLSLSRCPTYSPEAAAIPMLRALAMRADRYSACGLRQSGACSTRTSGLISRRRFSSAGSSGQRSPTIRCSIAGQSCAATEATARRRVSVLPKVGVTIVTNGLALIGPNAWSAGSFTLRPGGLSRRADDGLRPGDLRLSVRRVFRGKSLGPRLPSLVMTCPLDGFLHTYIGSALIADQSTHLRIVPWSHSSKRAPCLPRTWWAARLKSASLVSFLSY